MRNLIKHKYLFDIIWVISFSILLALPYIIPSSYPLRFFLLTSLVGPTMIFSGKLDAFSIVGEMHYWFAMKVISPRWKHNHIVWGTLILLLGIGAALNDGAESSSENIFLQSLENSLEYWVSIILVLIVNIVVGFYVGKNHKKRKI